MLTKAQIRELEQAAVDRGLSLEKIAIKVGQLMAEAIVQEYPQPQRVVAYLGKGNNAADALVALRELKKAGWAVAVRRAYERHDWSPFVQGLAEELNAADLARVPLERGQRLVCLDALVGIGAEGPLRAPLVELAEEMNEIRGAGWADTIAIDVPSGLDADTGQTDGVVVEADMTLTVADCKPGLVDESTVDVVGRLAVIELDELPAELESEPVVQTALRLADSYPRRKFSLHKGTAGRLAVVAGSPGMFGAAVMTSVGALRGGAGLVTCFCPADDMALLEMIKPHEVIVKGVESFIDVAEERFDALVIGPGMAGFSGNQLGGIWKLIQTTSCPIVLDAGGLTFTQRASWMGPFPRNMIITPHPGEMRRLFRNIQDLPRVEQVRQACDRNPCTVVLKGSRTLVGQAGKPICLNTTGHHGMATAGQGDLLSGMIGAFAAAGLEGYDAAKLGVWVAGRAGELAAKAEHSASVTTSITADYIGAALKDLAIRIY